MDLRGGGWPFELGRSLLAGKEKKQKKRRQIHCQSWFGSRQKRGKEIVSFFFLFLVISRMKRRTKKSPFFSLRKWGRGFSRETEGQFLNI